MVHSQRCDACRLIASKFHYAFELAESKLGINTHSFDEYEELGKFKAQKYEYLYTWVIFLPIPAIVYYINILDSQL